MSETSASESPDGGAPLDFSPLFQPITLRTITLPNRFVLPAMQRHWCGEAGRPLPRLGDYYRRRVEGGVGLLITEACAIDHASATQNPTFTRMNEETAAAWAHCLGKVKAAGGTMFMQLWHEGAIRAVDGDGPLSHHPTLSPSGLIHATKPNGRAATFEELTSIREAFVRSARLAQQVGFDGVEIHCAHGYLLDQFLWADTNQRTDGYGGADIRDRVRFPAEIVAAVRRAVGDDFVIGVRFSQWKEVDFQARVAHTKDDLATMIAALRAAGLDIFHASARRFWTPEWEGSDLGIAGWTKSLTDAVVIAVGSVGLDTDVMENFLGKEAQQTGEHGFRELIRRFNNREFDLVSVGRSNIGDPDWVTKVREGRLADIRTFTKQDVMGDVTLDAVAAEAHGVPGS